MFIPQSRIIERLADCRLNGYPDEHTEQFYNDNNNVVYFDTSANRYNQNERMDKMINNIARNPDELTNVNANSSTQKDYINNMTNMLNNSNFNELSPRTSNESSRPVEHFDEQQPSQQTDQQKEPTSVASMSIPPTTKDGTQTTTAKLDLSKEATNAVSNIVDKTASVIKTFLILVGIIVFTIVFIIFAIIFKLIFGRNKQQKKLTKSVADIEKMVGGLQMYLPMLTRPPQQPIDTQHVQPGGYAPYYF